MEIHEKQFDMTKEEAVKYCYEHRGEFISDVCESGEDGQQQFDCLVAIVEDGTISPSQLCDYGMEY